jgi:16S rRNA (guanine966-N2)-methyltransferase
VHSNKGKLRIIAGEFRGRRIAVPSRPGLRPTPDRVRETLFNWLGQWLPGLACLDLFAGSGALGFEAASRGAKRVVMVENDRPTVEMLEKTCREFAAGQVEIVAGDALAFLQKTDEKFDIVFLDPPFRQNALPAVLKRLPARLTAGARVYVESAVPLKVEEEWEELRASRAGQVSYQLLEWRGDDQGRVSGNV